MEAFWNNRYNSEEYAYGTSPNSFFREHIDKLKPGMILLPGEGEGRNSVYAAARGWVVDAIDYSEIARQKAMMLAENKSLFINYTVVDIADIELAEDYYDAAAIIFLHLESEDRKIFHQKVRRSIKPGGKLIIEAFSKTQIEYKTGGPDDLDMLYTIKDIENDFPDFKFEILSQDDDFLHEGQYHRGKASLIRAVAVKNNTR